MDKNKKIIAIIMSAIILCTICFSTFFIASMENHHCEELHCAICYEVSLCKTLMKSFFATIFSTIVGLRLLNIISTHQFIIPIKHNTLVSLKVQLLN